MLLMHWADNKDHCVYFSKFTENCFKLFYTRIMQTANIQLQRISLHNMLLGIDSTPELLLQLALLHRPAIPARTKQSVRLSFRAGQ